MASYWSERQADQSTFLFYTLLFLNLSLEVISAQDLFRRLIWSNKLTYYDNWVWDIAKKTHSHRVRRLRTRNLLSLVFSLDGRLIVSGSRDNTARIWEMIDEISNILNINDGDF